MQPRWRKMPPGWWQDGAMMSNLPPKWRYDGQLGAQDGQLGSILGAILGYLSHLNANVNENGEKAKNLEKLTVFKGFWVVRRVHLEAIWRPCWAMLAHLGDKMGYLGPSWRYVAPSWRQDAT